MASGRPPEVASSSKTRHDLERPKPASQSKPQEPKAEEKKDAPKPDAKPEEPKMVPVLPNVPHSLALETPRSYVDPLPVLKTVTWPFVSSPHPIRRHVCIHETGSEDGFLEKSLESKGFVIPWR